MNESPIRRLFAILRKMVTPNNISKIGIGTWGIAGYLHFDSSVDTNKQLNALKVAFDLGANYIDCSLKYADGESLRVIKELIEYAGRDNIFVSAKLERFIEKPEDVHEQLNEYLNVLGINEVDVLQLHAPSFTKIGIADTYREVNELIQSGKVRYAGASNFNVSQLTEVVEVCGANFVLHESLFNFSFRQNEDAGILGFCEANNFKFIAYQPLHRGKTEASSNALLSGLAVKHNKSQSQIILNWLVARGIIPLIRSDNIEHVKENLEALNFTMETAEYKLIDEYRDPILSDVPVDWNDSGTGNSIYQIANK